MINYWPLKFVSKKSVRNRTINGLNAIRLLVGENMPKKSVYSRLILGTWNIRNFDDNRFNHGPRLEESLYYIAEVISAFDVIAIQEVCRDLTPLRKVMKLLGDDYDMIMTDVTEGPSGNIERAGFIYNKNKVKFRNVAGEIVLPFKKQISDVTKKRQFARTPFSCSFKSGWFNFVFSSVHIYYGKQSKSSPQYKRRVSEISAVAKYLRELAEKEKDNYILVGDFNIDKPGDKAFNALKDQGFDVFQNKTGSNAKRNKFYDQISWLQNDRTVRQTQSDRNQGVLDVFSAVFADEHYTKYRREVKHTLENRLVDAKAELADARRTGDQEDIDKKKKAVEELKATIADDEEMREYYIKDWRTFQISDHLPLWVELDVDFSGEYLESVKQDAFS